MKPITIWGHGTIEAPKVHSLEVEPMPVSALISVVLTSPPRQRPTQVLYLERAEAEELARELHAAANVIEPLDAGGAESP